MSNDFTNGKKKYDDDEYLEPSDPIIDEAEKEEDLLDEDIEDDELDDYDENDEEDRAHLYRRRKGYSWEEHERRRRRFLDDADVEIEDDVKIDDDGFDNNSQDIVDDEDFDE